VKAPSRLDRLFEQQFADVAMPEAGRIREEGIGRRYPHATFETVWNATVAVLMQQGLVVRTDQAAGVILAVSTPPCAVLIDRQEPVRVTVWSMEQWYERPSAVATVPVRLPMERRERTALALFEPLATEVYAGKRWRFLEAADATGAAR
jgi:hypothetical protein